MTYPVTMDNLAQEIHDTSREKGFWEHEKIYLPEDPSEPRYAGRAFVTNPSIYGEKIALMHSELSEALEALRDGDRDKEEEELADTIIRILDYSHARGYSMDLSVRTKMEKNKQRPRLHGRNW